MSPFLGTTYLPDAAIAKAAAGLGPGDVLLVELQAMSGTGAMVPIEVYPEVRAAISDAVASGIVVVEPAANSGQDLASIPLDPSLGPNPWAPGTAGEDDSGALIVGAGGSGSPLLDVATVGDRQRTPESNFGARVDLQGVGAGVVTGGYADLPLATGDTAYTACFDGTSSASAIVAGAVAVIQGEAMARFGAPLTPYEMRTLLVETGLPQVVAESDDGNIGPRPQIAAAIEAIPSVRGRVRPRPRPHAEHAHAGAHAARRPGAGPGGPRDRRCAGGSRRRRAGARAGRRRAHRRPAARGRPPPAARAPRPARASPRDHHAGPGSGRPGHGQRAPRRSPAGRAGADPGPHAHLSRAGHGPPARRPHVPPGALHGDDPGARRAADQDRLTGRLTRSSSRPACRSAPSATPRGGQRRSGPPRRRGSCATR